MFPWNKKSAWPTLLVLIHSANKCVISNAKCNAIRLCCTQVPPLANATTSTMEGGSQHSSGGCSWDKIMAESMHQDIYPQVCNTSNPQNFQAEHHHFSCQRHFTHTGRRKESLSSLSLWSFSHITMGKLRRTCWSKGFITQAMLMKLKGWASIIFVKSFSENLLQVEKPTLCCC